MGCCWKLHLDARLLLETMQLPCRPVWLSINAPLKVILLCSICYPCTGTSFSSIISIRCRTSYNQVTHETEMDKELCTVQLSMWGAKPNIWHLPPTALFEGATNARSICTNTCSYRYSIHIYHTDHMTTKGGRNHTSNKYSHFCDKFRADGQRQQ
jgi:hypothetical protein